MARKLFINGVSGNMWISNGTITDAQADSSPIANSANLYFHSGLPYIQILQKINAGNIGFPARPRGFITWDDSAHCDCL